mgnify:CR=1 FL=1
MFYKGVKHGAAQQGAARVELGGSSVAIVAGEQGRRRRTAWGKLHKKSVSVTNRQAPNPEKRAYTLMIGCHMTSLGELYR